MQQKTEESWYIIDDVAQIPSPALVVYPHRVEQNIQKLISMAGSVDRLRPHIKTSKSSEAITRMIKSGISRFKCATIAEAELLAHCKAHDVLLAYQPVGPHIHRFITLTQQFPSTIFSCLIDNLQIAQQLNEEAIQSNLNIPIYIDVNVGMNRTGIAPAGVLSLAAHCQSLSNIQLMGLHCYDGHIHDASLDERAKKCNSYFGEIEELITQLNLLHTANFSIIAGGSPTFPIHINRPDVMCSPGTFIFWDKGYGDLLTEQQFLPAALVISRVVSIIDDRRLCLDLGHKAVSAENELAKRVFFINAPQAKAISQSEEHLVIEVPQDHPYTIGDVFYGIPYHICPTVALYDKAYAIVDHQVDGSWPIEARKRKLTI